MPKFYLTLWMWNIEKHDAHSPAYRTSLTVILPFTVSDTWQTPTATDVKSYSHLHPISQYHQSMGLSCCINHYEPLTSPQTSTMPDWTLYELRMSHVLKRPKALDDRESITILSTLHKQSQHTTLKWYNLVDVYSGCLERFDSRMDAKKTWFASFFVAWCTVEWTNIVFPVWNMIYKCWVFHIELLFYRYFTAK